MKQKDPRLTEFELLRKQKARRRFFKRLLVLTLMTLAIALAIVLREDISNLGLGNRIADLYASWRPGMDYPVEVPAGRVVSLSALGQDLAVLGDTNLYLYNTTARRMASYQHGYKSPILRTAGDRALTFDRGGRQFRVDSRSKPLFSENGSQTIFSANLSPDGTMAVLRSSTRYQAEAVVYDRQFNPFFYWYTSVGPVLDVCLDQQGQGMAVSAVSASEGLLYSLVTCLRFDSEKPVAEITLQDQLVLSMTYTETGNLQVLTDRQALLFSPDGKELASFDYDGAQLGRFVNSSQGYLFFVLDSLGDGGSLRLVALGPELQELGSAGLTSKAVGLAYDHNRLYLLAENGVYTYDTALKQATELPLSGIYAIQPAGNALYGVTAEQILRYSMEQGIQSVD